MDDQRGPRDPHRWEDRAGEKPGKFIAIGDQRLPRGSHRYEGEAAVKTAKELGVGEVTIEPSEHLYLRYWYHDIDYERAAKRSTAID